MRATARRHISLLIAAALSLLALGATLVVTAATGADLNQLQSELGSNSAKAQSLSSSVSGLTREVNSLDRQIQLVEARAANVRQSIAQDRAKTAVARAAVQREQRVLAKLKTRLALAEKLLSAELVSRYEQPQQTMVSVILDAKGFQQMLDQLQFMDRANAQEQSIIKVTRIAKAQASAAEARVLKLEQADLQATQQRLTQAKALAGMQSLLASRRTSLAHAEAARAAALAATQARGAQLRSAISKARAEQLAAEQAAQQLQSGSSGGGTAVSAPTDGWAIPYAIVLCESGGQNLPPNGAGASGYYQIIPSTWKDFGGSTAQAYQASKSEQDAVASRIWDGGKGASNWTCSAIVGIT